MAEKSDRSSGLQRGITDIGSSSASPETSSSGASTLSTRHLPSVYRPFFVQLANYPYAPFSEVPKDQQSNYDVLPHVAHFTSHRISTISEEKIRKTLLEAYRHIGLPIQPLASSPSNVSKQGDTTAVQAASTHCSSIELRAPEPLTSPFSAFEQFPDKKVPNQDSEKHSSNLEYAYLQTQASKRLKDVLLSLQQKDPKMRDSKEMDELTKTEYAECQSTLANMLQNIQEEQCNYGKPCTNMQTLLLRLKIPASLVHFDPEKEIFY